MQRLENKDAACIAFHEATSCIDEYSADPCIYEEIDLEESIHFSEDKNDEGANRQAGKLLEMGYSRKNSSTNYQCRICNKSFKNMCSRLFSFETSLISHLKLHNNIKDYKCSYCSKMFARRRNMLSHEKLIHVKEKPFMCSICGKTYTDSTCFKKHITNHQNPQLTERAPAVQAQQPKSRKTKPEKPILPTRKEAVEKKPRQRRNTGPKKHKCDLCDKMFARRRNVSHHMIYTHNNLKPHECQFCGKKYSDITSFKRHIRAHTDPVELRAPAKFEATDEYLIEDNVLDDFNTIELQSGSTDEAITFIVITES
ncbi:zinc finger protein OZF-like isoform X2 [Toxorhynchites rutilus septentrionalis]|uniref:zinc finger protein OZF-like isoform X2 n=1 Tax=Toxorhynchites rutilus septentrionalis TaxID=329112 RepID=UPI002478B2E2|nr:zinc finger protein OZF-like isoform X2 [Toxorhynchites rutilus septentrionalis]